VKCNDAASKTECCKIMRGLMELDRGKELEDMLCVWFLLLDNVINIKKWVGSVQVVAICGRNRKNQ